MRRAATCLLLCLLAPVLMGAGGPWTSPHNRDHPLAGRIWSTEAGDFVSEETLVATLSKADFVLLGERHDNPDHHRLQARMVGALAAAGRQPAVAFEMIATDRQPALDSALDTPLPTAAAIAEAVAWSESGWPDFAMYAPIFETALASRLPLVAAAPAREEMRDLTKAALTADFSLGPWLEGSKPLSDTAYEDLAKELVSSHCSDRRTPHTDAMAMVQQAKDARMAARMIAGGAKGAVLIAGTGHIRNDRGVPWHLRALAPDARIATLAFMDVAAGDDEPGDYLTAFDYVWFTPAIDVEDPCERFREQLEKMHEKAAE